ncbi:MAG: serine protease [Elusimicrobiota bacterium]|nr:serine protease [Elusimicrobiota bacterium]
MKKLITLLVLSSLIIPFTHFNLSANGKVIYGDDDRLDYNKMSASIKPLADSVVSLWNSYDVTLEGDSYKLDTSNFGDTVGLCPEERFREQKMGAFCSGTLVGEDMIMTAGHCITSEYKCKNTKFVFGFAIKGEKGAPDTISAKEVYGCSKIVKRFLGKEVENSDVSASGLGADYALIKLDRAVKGHAPLPVSRNPKTIAQGTDLFVIGHPVGLPVKLAGGASVRNASPDGYFVANLDTYGGNSGSAVFNKKTNLIEGILVRGETDFVSTSEGCRISNVETNAGGRGEDVTKVSVLASFIPELSKKAPTAEENMVRDMAVANILDEDMGDFSIPMPVFE